MTLNQSHHLLKSIVKYKSSQVYSTMQTEKFINEFNIAQKNAAFGRIRECFGERKSEYEKLMSNSLEQHLNAQMDKRQSAYDNSVKWLHTSQRFNIDSSKKEWVLRKFLQHKQLTHDNKQHLDTNEMGDFASELFKFCAGDNPSLVVSEMVQDLMALGLAPSHEYLLKMMAIVLKKPVASLHQELMNANDFHKLCSSSSRIVNRVLRILNEHTKAYLCSKKPSKPVFPLNRSPVRKTSGQSSAV